MKLFSTYLFIALAFLIQNSSKASLSSRIPSTIEELTISNSHYVDKTDHSIARGMAPRSKVAELVNWGATDVLIFKNQTRNEVDKEIRALENLGFVKGRDIHHINFPWKNVNLNTACESVIDALKLMREVRESSDRQLFFHCTVGEDRTGVLSGIYRMLNEGWTKKRAFEDEMCARGYASGNYKKPWVVVNEIRKGLTPLFMLMAKEIERGELTLSNLESYSCNLKSPSNLKILKCR